MYPYSSKPREYWPSQADSDAAARVAARNAPANIKRAIDRERQRHGMAPLWNVEVRSRKAVPDTIVLVGPCCPGLSRPVTAGTDGLHLPEVIAADAFDSTLRLIKARAVTIALEAGHGGEVIASTADDTLTFTTSRGTGLMVVARIKVSRLSSEMLAAAIRGTMGLSVSMLPRRVEIVMHNGRRVRSIREVELKALAALWRPVDHGRACYPSARMFAAFENDRRAVRRAMRLASIHANTAVLKAGWH